MIYISMQVILNGIAFDLISSNGGHRKVDFLFTPKNIIDPTYSLVMLTSSPTLLELFPCSHAFLASSQDL